MQAVRADTLAIQDFRCDTGTSQAELIREAAKLGPRLRLAILADTSVGTLRAAGLLELATGTEDRATLTRALLRLDRAAARDANPLALRDAAAAHAVAARGLRDPSELLRALDLIERAVLRDSADPTIRFNRALLLEVVGLVGEAAAAWHRASQGTLLKQEALVHFESQRMLDSRASARQLLARAGTYDEISDSLIARMRVTEPEALRESVLDVMLPAWAEASLLGGEARMTLAGAERIGAALAVGGDSTASAAMRLLKQSPALALVQRALAAYGRGREYFDRGQFELAAPDLAFALEMLQGSTGEPNRTVELWGWPAVYLGAYQVLTKRYPEADKLFAQVEEETAGSPLLALRGRALWGAALSLARQDRPREAIDRYRKAIALFNAAGEKTNAGALESQLADVYALVGDNSAAVAAQLRAARAFLARRDLGLLQGFLQSFAAFELRAGRPHAALAILREAVHISHRTGRTKDVPEAMSRLASAEVRVGQNEAAKARLAEARRQLETVGSELMRAGVDAEIARVEARLSSGQGAIILLNRVVDYFEGQRIPSLAPALMQRADANLGVGDTAAAERDLDRALLLVRRRASQLDAIQAASSREVERGVFERRVALRIARGETEQALAEIDGRLSWRLDQPARISDLVAKLDPDAAVLAYAALPERLLIWAITREGIVMETVPVTASTLALTVDQLTALMRGGADSATVEEVSEDLRRHLVVPVAARLRGKRRLAIVADPVLAGAPFAALRDSATGQLMLEEHVLQYSFGVREAMDGLGRRAAPSRRKVLLVGNPAFDRLGTPELALLGHSASEIESLRRLYPTAGVLQGESATRAALIDQLESASVFHFSGHAVSTPQGLHGSRLVLARSGVTNDPGVLTGVDIAQMRLPRLRLAILSACETLSRTGSDSYRMDGLAEAFLVAGAEGVIGSHWVVDDARTARLMARLHRGLAEGADPAEALRAAQLTALKEPGGRAAGLRTWSAFRFVTR